VHSQIPSQAINRNSSLLVIFFRRISGTAQTVYSSGGRKLFCLNSRSPIARDRFRTPFTRPSEVIKPPPANIRAFII
jgi:hypothetical protein